MTTAANWTDLFQNIGATTCPKCQSLAFVAEPAAREDGKVTPLAINAPARFCFECGYQTAGEAQSSGRVTTP